MQLLQNPDNLQEITDAYKEMGAAFITDPQILQKKLLDIKAFVFDWDGVFNTGHKGIGNPSPFSEPDASGITLMRYAYERANGSFPAIAIITGEGNENALDLAEREFYNAIYLKSSNKAESVAHLAEKLGIQVNQIACFYDDYNDMPMARVCGLRFMINKSSNLLYKSFMASSGWCSYITANVQPNNPIREVTELIMGLLGQYKNCGNSRAHFDQDFKDFLQKRKQIKPEVWLQKDGVFSLQKHNNIGFK